jgi:hypothetical protein
MRAHRRTYTPSDGNIYKYMPRAFKRIYSHFPRVAIFVAKNSCHGFWITLAYSDFVSNAQHYKTPAMFFIVGKPSLSRSLLHWDLT